MFFSSPSYRSKGHLLNIGLLSVARIVVSPVMSGLIFDRTAAYQAYGGLKSTLPCENPMSEARFSHVLHIIPFDHYHRRSLSPLPHSSPSNLPFNRLSLRPFMGLRLREKNPRRSHSPVVKAVALRRLDSCWLRRTPPQVAALSCLPPDAPPAASPLSGFRAR
jgi:hypothetical protein